MTIMWISNLNNMEIIKLLNSNLTGNLYSYIEYNLQSYTNSQTMGIF